MLITKQQLGVSTTPYGSWLSSYSRTTYYTDAQLDSICVSFSSKPVPSSPVFYQGERTIVYENGRQRFNFCDHTVSGSYLYASHRAAWYLRTSGSTKYYAFVKGSEAKPSDYAPTIGDPDSFITPERRKLAWSEMYPDLNDGFALTNFLWELSDFRQLMKLCTKLGRIFSHLDYKSLGTRTLAEVYLGWSFGVKPMVSDLQNIYDLVTSFPSLVNKFIDEGKRVQTYHYRVPLTASRMDVTPTHMDYTSVYTEDSFQYVATLKCSYEYDRPSNWTAFLRAAGLRLTPEIIWNGIPFSFVIDWVLDIQSFLRQFDKDPRVRVRVVDYCDSVKLSQVITAQRAQYFNNWAYGSAMPVIRRYAGAGVSTSDPASLIWSRESSSYLRKPGFPDTGYALPALDTLSARELLLGGALMRANIRQRF